MSRKPCIEMHCEDIATAGLLLSHGVNGCGFSIGRAQCNSAAQSDAAADSFTRFGAAPEQSGGNRQQDWLQGPVDPPVDRVEAVFATKSGPPDMRDVRRLKGEGAVPHHANGEQLSPASPE